MYMKLTGSVAAAILALAVGACGDNQTPNNEPQTLTPAAPPAATPPAADAAPFESDTMPPECDFAERDTTQMNETEHQQMLDDCEAAKRRSGTDNTTTSPSDTPQP